MAIEIKMPSLSPTMEKGTLAQWLVSVGDEIKAGDIIAEIETDKATMEVEADDDGTLTDILVDDGEEDVPVGEVIAILDGDGKARKKTGSGGDNSQKDKDESGKDAKGGDEEKSAADEPDEDRKETKEETGDQESEQEKAKQEAEEGKGPERVPPAPATGNGKRIFASPLARRLAKEKGIDLAAIDGSGPHGRIVKSDIDGAEPAEGRGVGEAPGEAYERVRLSTMRKVIAERLVQAKQSVPHFYLTVDIELDALLAARKQINEKADGEYKISVNDFIIKALGAALNSVPDANVQFAGDHLKRFANADIGVAVATEGGLITPIVRAAQKKSLREIAQEMKDLAARARDGKLEKHEYEGGTAGLSNLGMYGIKQFDAVINPPQTTILAVGAGEERAVVEDGDVRIATVMSATLSCDHRAVDGALGARLLTAVKEFIENPVMMLV